jgi:hypothetical protein
MMIRVRADRLRPPTRPSGSNQPRAYATGNAVGGLDDDVSIAVQVVGRDLAVAPLGHLRQVPDRAVEGTRSTRSTSHQTARMQ